MRAVLFFCLWGLSCFINAADATPSSKNEKRAVLYNMLTSLHAGLIHAAALLPEIEEAIAAHAHAKDVTTLKRVKSNFVQTKQLIKALQTKTKNPPKNVTELKNWVSVLTTVNTSLSSIQKSLQLVK